MNHHLLERYRKDGQDRYIIDMFVSDLPDLFSKYDPSPLHRRNLNPLAMAHIMHELVVFPHSAQVAMTVHLPKKLRGKIAEKDVAQAIRNYFKFKLLDSELHMQRRIVKGRNFLIVASVFFLAAVLLATFLTAASPGNMLLSVLSQGLIVGGWVSLWYPIEIILYDWWPIYDERTRYSKLLSMEIGFNYA